MCNLCMSIYKEGISEGAEKTAINMLKKNMDIDTIMEVTGLSEKNRGIKVKFIKNYM